MRDGYRDVLGRQHGSSIFIITVLGISNIKEVTMHRTGKYWSEDYKFKSSGDQTGISNVVRGAGMRQRGIVETVANPLVHSPS